MDITTGSTVFELSLPADAGTEEDLGIFFDGTKGATNAICAKTIIMANVRVFLVIEQSNHIPVNCLKFPLRQMKSVKPKVLLMRGESFD